MSVVAVGHDPVLATASGLSHGVDPLDGEHGGRIGQPSVHEVPQHVYDHQRRVHLALLGADDVPSDRRPSCPCGPTDTGQEAATAHEGGDGS